MSAGTLQMSGSLAGHLMNQPSMVIFPKPEKDEVIRIQECKTPSPVPRQNPVTKINYFKIIQNQKS